MRLPRQLVACVMDGQVGVESTEDCGPARAEAGDWHTAQATRGLSADAMTAGQPSSTCWKLTRVTTARTPCHGGMLMVVYENIAVRDELPAEEVLSALQLV